jgi:DnaJ-class molecular chaperone
MDYYQTLGISKTASDVEIKNAYRKKALEWHPDRNKSPEATAKFKEINEAYEILSNPQKKQSYDQFGSAGPQQSGPFNYSYQSYGGNQNPFEGMDFGGFSDPFELFEQFFGGGFSSGGSRRNRRQSYSLNISFMEAMKGTEKQVQIGDKTMKIKIPAGVDSGNRVRFGDFDIVLSVSLDKIYQREGQNLFVNIDIDYPQAVLGTTIEVPTIDGPVTLKVPAGTQPDTTIRLRGRGVKDTRGGTAGDEYVRIKIKIPTKITREQKELLERFQKSSPSSHGGWF